MPRTRDRSILAALLLLAALSIALAACGGAGGKTPTSTKVATRTAVTATRQLGGTPTATLTPSAVATEGAAAQPSATPAATEPPPPAATSTPPASSQTTIGVSLREFSVSPSAGSAAAGTVTFNVSNDGTIPHDLWVIRSDLAADGLPINQATYMVDELQVNVIARFPPMQLLATESSAQFTLELPAGRYVLICNVATHYETGMHAAFTVQ